MKRTHDVLDFLARRRIRNWLRRALSTPSQLIPLLLLSPAIGLALLSAVAVLFIPSFGTEYERRALATFVIVMYVLLPLRGAVPGTAVAIWAREAWLTAFLFYVFILAVGRVFQALFASRVDGLVWARGARVALFSVVALVGTGLAVDGILGHTPFSLVVRVFSSRAVEWAFLPCAITADTFVAPFTPRADSVRAMGVLFVGAMIATGVLLAFGRPACESAIVPTARLHAVWQALRKSDASSIRAAQLMGRSVRGWRGGLPRLGRGAFALAGKSVLYGWRNSPWGVAVVGVIMLTPVAMGPSIMRALEDSDALSAADLRWLPLVLLGLVFAWSQRVRLIAREEFTNLAFLKCLPAPPQAIMAALLCVPTATFSLFMLGLGVGVCVGLPAADPEHGLLGVAVTPALYAALGGVHLCSSLLFPTYDPSLSRTYAADLAMMPVALWVFATVVGGGLVCLSAGLGPIVSAIAATALALAYLIGGLRVAGALFRRFEPGA